MTELHHDQHHDHGASPDPTLVGNTAARLRPLSELDDYEIADGDPDIRGWRVKDASGGTVGVVHDLLADLETREVRYLDVQLEGASDPAVPTHVLLPIGLARLDADGQAVSLGAVRREALRDLSPYDHRPLDRGRECELIGRLQGNSGPVPDTGADFYRHSLFGTAHLWGVASPARQRTTYVVAGRAGPPGEQR